jgi:nickel-dependent lactate racemase
MRLGLEWGRQSLELEVAAENVVALRRDAPAPALADPTAAVKIALEEPLDFPPLRRALTPDDHIAIFVDEQLPDVARLLVPILEHVCSAGVSTEAITLLCVPPSSGQPWLEDLPDAFQDVHVEVHQPGDRRKLSYLAATKHGRRIYLNRSAVDADQLILLTRRAYDPVRGSTGAVEALYPGLSDEATQQEAFAQLYGTAAAGDAQHTVQRDAAEVAWLLGAPFLVQVIAGIGNDIAHVLAGTVQSSAEGQRLLAARWAVTADRPADVVVAGIGGDPETITTEDIARAFLTAANVVKPGGRIALLTEMTPILGPSFELLRQCDQPAEAVQLILNERPVDLAAGFMWASAARRARLYLLSGLTADVAEELFVTPLERAPEAQRLLGSDVSCVLLPDAHKVHASIR